MILIEPYTFLSKSTDKTFVIMASASEIGPVAKRHGWGGFDFGTILYSLLLYPNEYVTISRSNNLALMAAVGSHSMSC